MLRNDEEMSLEAPKFVEGELRGGTGFERLGQEGVKRTRCYSLITKVYCEPNSGWESL
jgi:hypothetical protein